MSRSSVSQPQRTQNNPLNLGAFSQTALRYLKGILGPQWKVVGRADTNQTSNGGIGGGTFNHWFSVTLDEPGWIILTKGPPRPQYIQVSVYALDNTPLQGNPIFDADSIQITSDGSVYIPYLNTVMNAQSDLYNTFNQTRLDRGDDRYYPLSKGSYLICVSSTRNESLEYQLGVVIEFPAEEIFFELEDLDGAVCLQEITVEDYEIILEVGDDAYYNTVHDHSLSEWQNAWEREHQDTDRFPELFVPLTNRP
jgi:hypothetical protein